VKLGWRQRVQFAGLRNAHLEHNGCEERMDWDLSQSGHFLRSRGPDPTLGQTRDLPSPMSSPNSYGFQQVFANRIEEVLTEARQYIGILQQGSDGRCG
jgi:hypothetical protein